MAGFDVDPAALRAAVEELKDQQKQLDRLSTQARRGIPSAELTAGDQATTQAREVLEKRAAEGPGSLAAAARDLRDTLAKKIEAFEQTLKQYELDDTTAAEDARRVSS
ncbi:hypothetical protein [Saccharopolyspora taberi]|uniref:PE family protein n=1 Tax=Saccharopolyspora taberi TaxID=60895 RepID=A0ABN3VKR8_9PSEU